MPRWGHRINGYKFRVDILLDRFPTAATETSFSYCLTWLWLETMDYYFSKEDFSKSEHSSAAIREFSTDLQLAMELIKGTNPAFPVVYSLTIYLEQSYR